MTAEQQRAKVAELRRIAKEKKQKEERNVRDANQEEVNRIMRQMEYERAQPERKQRELKKIADANIVLNLRNAGNPIVLVRPHKSPARIIKKEKVGLDIFK